MNSAAKTTGTVMMMTSTTKASTRRDSTPSKYSGWVTGS
jgi:hypothetical protein